MQVSRKQIVARRRIREGMRAKGVEAHLAGGAIGQEKQGGLLFGEGVYLCYQTGRDGRSQTNLSISNRGYKNEITPKLH